MNRHLHEAEQIRANATCLHSAEAVTQALDQMAAQITADLSDKNPLLLGVMNGGLLPLSYLMQRLDFPLTIDYVHATRYQEDLTGKELIWQRTPNQSLTDRHVLIVDDILDEGHTLAGLLNYCQIQQPASLKTAVLVHKQHDRGVSPQLDYCGLAVPDQYVFGCGMDYKGYWRNISAIYAVSTIPKT
ncbi:MAG: hypoxanthine-guanine phosphoribosyltransferase [Pseudomonadota bacterium]